MTTGVSACSLRGRTKNQLPEANHSGWAISIFCQHEVNSTSLGWCLCLGQFLPGISCIEVTQERMTALSHVFHPKSAKHVGRAQAKRNCETGGLYHFNIWHLKTLLIRTKRWSWWSWHVLISFHTISLHQSLVSPGDLTSRKSVFDGSCPLSKSSERYKASFTWRHCGSIVSFLVLWCRLTGLQE